ncbi:MAG: V-type ATP synthase subunit I [Candidatus Krumholzibacteriales bacterium]
MAVSSMLKVQLLGHDSVRERLKRRLRDLGAVQVTETETGEGRSGEETPPVGNISRLIEYLEESVSFLEDYIESPSLWEKLSGTAIQVGGDEVKKLAAEFPVKETWQKSNGLSSQIRELENEIDKSRELAGRLQPWKSLDTSLEELETEGFSGQLWSFPSGEVEQSLDELKSGFEFSHFERVSGGEGRVHFAVILPREDDGELTEALKKAGGRLNSFEDEEGTPAEIIGAEMDRMEEAEAEIEELHKQAAGLAEDIIEKLYVLIDYYNEQLALSELETRLHKTDSVFLMEGWVRELDRKKLERGILGEFADVEIAFRKPGKDEKPPVHLENGKLAEPNEFVMTLYGNPQYREIDPTPFFAPFFILFFAMCLTDAGYGIALSIVSAFILFKFKPSGGARKLIRLMLTGGLVTTVVGILAGGLFGISLGNVPFLRKFVFINPIEEPMKMLYLSFFLGIVHILFGMGISMVRKFQEGLIADGIFDNLFWMIFLVFLAPLGFAGILDGEVPPYILSWSGRGAVIMAAAIFLTGGRKKESLIMKALGGLAGFYDIVGYFGDVLSYARLLALGLATSAIAMAVNDIAGMVAGMPFYTGYIAMILILAGGHLFNLAVNSLGGFVHSARLQYLEFFSKFFSGGGRPFKPFRSERRYSVIRDKE